MTAEIVTITPVTEPDELFCRYEGQHRPQPVVLALDLDLEDGELAATYNGTIGSGVPEAVYHRRTLWIDIPPLTAEAANSLMADVLPLAQRILNGAEIEWDGNNHVGRLDNDAAEALDELVAQCADENFAPADLVSEYEAGDWFGGEDRGQTLDRLGLTADTTDEQIDTMAAAEETEATSMGSEYGYVILTGAADWLTSVREEMRDELREESENVAEQARTATTRRDELIRRRLAWGDSSRTIGTSLGLSHTQVQNIGRA